LQQADVPTLTEGHAPGRDTIMILLGVPEPDSVAGDFTHYTLFSSQTDSTSSGEPRIYASRLLCSLKQCFFLSLSPVGGGARVRPVQAQRLPPNKRMQQTGASVATFLSHLHSDAMMRTNG
jgi:hypothetical protein